eukprot:8358980-Lingulodinium_polyedra.AAC.1
MALADPQAPAPEGLPEPFVLHALESLLLVGQRDRWHVAQAPTVARLASSPQAIDCIRRWAQDLAP